MSPPGSKVQLYLLRHGEVSSHHGDVPITEDAANQAEKVGRRFGADVSGIMTVLCGETRRARETAEHLSRGIEIAGGRVEGPTVAHALRNPDLYLGGHRVNMVSTPEALAAQVPDLEPEEVAGLEFFPDFLSQPDRVGWWLRHDDPPGERSSVVAVRIEAFARSLVNPFREDRTGVVAVTHSPLLRAIGLAQMGYDIGEPDWVSGLAIEVDRSGELDIDLYPGSG